MGILSPSVIGHSTGFKTLILWCYIKCMFCRNVALTIYLYLFCYQVITIIIIIMVIFKCYFSGELIALS